MLKNTKIIEKLKSKNNILKNTKGENYIDVIIGIMVLMMVLVLTMNVYKVMIVKQDLDTITDQLITIASAEGCFGSSYERRVNELKAEFFDFEVEENAPNGWFSGDSNAKKVDWANTMQVKVTVRVNLDGAGVFQISAPVSSSRSGVSARHWVEGINNIGDQIIVIEPEEDETEEPIEDEEFEIPGDDEDEFEF